jgi:cell division protein FtsL
MAKSTKKKKVRNAFLLVHVALIMFFISTTSFLASSLFLRSYNNTLSTQAQDISRQISALQLQNDAISVEIARLASADRIDEIASNNGLTRNSANVISITNGENGD